MSSEIQYVVHWEDPFSGKTGHGKPMSKELAKTWADTMNLHHPNMKHWIDVFDKTIYIKK